MSFVCVARWATTLPDTRSLARMHACHEMLGRSRPGRTGGGGQHGRINGAVHVWLRLNFRQWHVGCALVLPFTPFTQRFVIIPPATNHQRFTNRQPPKQPVVLAGRARPVPEQA